MAEELKAIFPTIPARKYEIRLIPKGASYDGAWMSIAVSEKTLPLEFAITAPETSADVIPWISRLTALLAHETSHSYYWFHPAEVAGRFSDEVVAYTVEKCIGRRTSVPLEPARLPAKFEELERQADTQPPAIFYAQNRDRYPDSLIARILADSLYRKRRKTSRPTDY